MIRKAKLSDLKRLYKIVHDCIKFVKENKKTKNELKRMYKINKIKEYFKKSDIFVFEKNKNVIGCGRLEKDHIWMMYVDPKCHKIGVGSSIMKTLESLARKRKIKKVYLYPLNNAVGFYKKLGYKLIKSDIKEDKEMMKVLR
jgi:N-acetylglutamate synthase-like GNAT family acetyltransferase